MNRKLNEWHRQQYFYLLNDVCQNIKHFIADFFLPKFRKRKREDKKRKEGEDEEEGREEEIVKTEEEEKETGLLEM